MALLAATPHSAHAFGLDDVTARARELAAQPYQPPVDSLSSALKGLDYDQQRDIRFKPERALWRADGLPFELMFFYPSRDLLPVAINEITDGGVQPVRQRQEDFDFGANRLDPKTLGEPGFAGFRVHYALNTPAYKDEVFVALGASYFRAVGAGQHYGLSARGLALDAAGAAGPEEFPRFTEYWIERPAAHATTLVFYALLESPRATGAYRFELRPGSETVLDVKSRVFTRGDSSARPIHTIGIAPLTSMFFSGENQPSPGDFRPEVHDSDGLLLHNGNGEWIWRPLANPAQTVLTSFALQSPKGFGLMQRDREFRNYEDTEARYEQRPSAWVEPVGDWGAGRVELLQFRTPDETHDNVVAYWVPAAQPEAGEALDIAYRLHWQGNGQQRPPGGWTVQSRRGVGYSKVSAAELQNQVQYIVDFAGPALDALPADAPVKAIASTNANGRILENLVYRNPVTGGWRMTLRIARIDAAQAVELRAFLQHGTDTVSETWSNIVFPK